VPSTRPFGVQEFAKIDGLLGYRVLALDYRVLAFDRLFNGLELTLTHVAEWEFVAVIERPLDAAGKLFLKFGISSELRVEVKSRVQLARHGNEILRIAEVTEPASRVWVLQDLA